MGATVFEPQLGACHKIGDRPRDEHLARFSQGRNSGGDVDGYPGYVIAPYFDLSRVQASTNIEADLTGRVSDRRCAMDSPCWTVESSEYAVAGPLHQVAAKSGKLPVDRPIMELEAIVPDPIAQRGRLLGGAHDVGEEHGSEEASRVSYVARPCQELLDLAWKVGVARPWDVIGAGDLDVASTGNVFGQIAAMGDATELVVP